MVLRLFEAWFVPSLWLLWFVSLVPQGLAGSPAEPPSVDAPLLRRLVTALATTDMRGAHALARLADRDDVVGDEARRQLAGMVPWPDSSGDVGYLAVLEELIRRHHLDRWREQLLLDAARYRTHRNAPRTPLPRGPGVARAGGSAAAATG
jgi:hypothetical protein